MSISGEFQWSKFGRFWAKTLGYSPRFWRWSILVSPGNRSNSLKRLQNPYKINFKSLRHCVCRFRVNSQGSKFGRFWAKTLGYSPWFWSWPILVNPANRSKLSETAPNPYKINFKSLRHRLCRFRVNSQGSKLGHFRAKSLGYSPWFWRWSILVSHGNRSKLSETAPKPL